MSSSIPNTNSMNNGEAGASTTGNRPVYNVKQEMEKSNTIRKNGIQSKSMKYGIITDNNKGMINSQPNSPYSNAAIPNSNNYQSGSPYSNSAIPNSNNYQSSSPYSNAASPNSTSYQSSSPYSNASYPNSNNGMSNNYQPSSPYSNASYPNSNNGMSNNYQSNSPYMNANQNMDAYMYYQQLLLNKYREEQNAKDIINQINDDVDLSNVTLNENENGTTNKKDKKDRKDIYESGRITKIDDEESCCTCCKCCCITICFIIFFFILCILALLGFVYHPRIPAITIKSIDINNMTNIVSSLKSYSNYYRELYQIFPYENLDLSFDFNVTFTLNSLNLYNCTFTDIDMEFIYPGTNETPKFHIARGFKDYIQIERGKKTNVTIPFTAHVNFQEILYNGYFTHVFSSCTWDAIFRGNTKILGIPTKYFVFNYAKRFTKTCLIEEILTEFQKS